ncbi:MAG: hypothetical protein COV45_07310 [Deltaproteobacteria bacterium CG11_big_fil_rev_8_21_14_0_20_47_16]|nr:MAG: hypothetical protein COV45_07310 [Deltaproteobacteria bacterium CG11_big_fil_rev_8_21_14_0_20_47_16]
MKKFEWTWANGLTLLRLVLVPVIATTFFLDHYVTTFLLFCVAAGSDLIDGSVARAMGQRSEWGAFIDPIADKSLMLVTTFCLMWVRVLPDWFFVLVLIKDASVLGGLWYLNRRHIKVEMEPLWWSKWTTLMLIFTVFLGFIVLSFPSLEFLRYPVGDFMTGSMFFTSGLVILTTLKYARRGLEIIADNTPSAK